MARLTVVVIVRVCAGVCGWSCLRLQEVLAWIPVQHGVVHPVRYDGKSATGEIKPAYPWAGFDETEVRWRVAWIGPQCGTPCGLPRPTLFALSAWFVVLMVVACPAGYSVGCCCPPPPPPDGLLAHTLFASRDWCFVALAPSWSSGTGGVVEG